MASVEQVDGWTATRQREHADRTREFFAFMQRLEAFHKAVAAGDHATAQSILKEQRAAAAIRRLGG